MTYLCALNYLVTCENTKTNYICFAILRKKGPTVDKN